MEYDDVSFFNTYVGMPYTRKGRSRDGCDCLGLIRFPFIDAGLPVPDFDIPYESPRDPAISERIDGFRPRWERVGEGAERPFDVILIRDRPWHVGLVVMRGYMLHMPMGVTSVIEPFTSVRFAERIDGIYRYKA